MAQKLGGYLCGVGVRSAAEHWLEMIRSSAGIAWNRVLKPGICRKPRLGKRLTTFQLELGILDAFVHPSTCHTLSGEHKARLMLT